MHTRSKYVGPFTRRHLPLTKPIDMTLDHNKDPKPSSKTGFMLGTADDGLMLADEPTPIGA